MTNGLLGVIFIRGNEPPRTHGADRVQLGRSKMRRSKIIYQDDERVIRLTDEENAVTILVHPVVDGQEHTPLALMIGHNCLRVPKAAMTSNSQLAREVARS